MENGPGYEVDEISVIGRTIGEAAKPSDGEGIAGEIATLKDYLNPRRGHLPRTEGAPLGACFSIPNKSILRIWQTDEGR